MRKILFFAIFLAFIYTRSHASEGPPPKNFNPVIKELKNDQEKLKTSPLVVVTVTRHDQKVVYTVCYAQEAFTPCGTFDYTLCFDSEPSMEQLLDAVDIIDSFINANCT